VTKLDQLTASPDETVGLMLEPDGRRFDRAADQREPDERIRGRFVEALDA
jgi:hypothetical protein